jgi:hypothetical protein
VAEWTVVLVVNGFAIGGHMSWFTLKTSMVAPGTPPLSTASRTRRRFWVLFTRSTEIGSVIDDSVAEAEAVNRAAARVASMNDVR